MGISALLTISTSSLQECMREIHEAYALLRDGFWRWQSPKTMCRRHAGGCQNYGPLLGPLNTSCRIILRIQKGTIMLTTTHVGSVVRARQVYELGGLRADCGCQQCGVEHEQIVDSSPGRVVNEDAAIQI